MGVHKEQLVIFEDDRPPRPKTDMDLLMEHEIDPEEYIKRLKATVDARLGLDRTRLERLAQPETHLSIGQRVLSILRRQNA